MIIIQKIVRRAFFTITKKLISKENHIVIYADNAATTKLDIEAFEAMKPFLLDEYGNASQLYSFSREPKKAIQKAREKIAACINAEPKEIFFTSCGTESDNWALKGTMFVRFDKRSLITTQVEHHAILNSAAAIEKMGYAVNYLPVDETCTVLPEFLANTIKNNDAKLVSVMFANNEVGSVQPIENLAQIAHEHGSLFHTDAVQAVGHLPINVKKLGVDMLSSSAHKFNGPKGIGFLFVKRGVQLGSFMNGGAQEFGRRAGTENVASIVGMAVALEKNCKKLEEHRKHLLNLENILLESLRESNLDFKRNGSSDHVPGNVSLSFKGSDGEMLLHRLDLKGICVSTGSACNSKETEISHVLKAMHVPEEYARGTIRISLGKDNTVEDVQKIAAVLNGILEK